MKKVSMWLILAIALPVSGVKVVKDDNSVTKVVKLLEDLKARVETDGETEQAAYDKYACWCEQTTAKTAATITEVKDLLKSTGNTILKLKGSVATLSSEILGLAADIESNQEKQTKHTNIREKENTAYVAEKAELEAAIGALEKAITVLSGATGASFMQTSQWTSAVSEVASKMSKASISVKLTEKQVEMLGQLSGKVSGSYAPQSATIQGILSDMYTTFSKNLQTSTADEATAHRNYEDLMSTLQEQLKTLQESLVKKQQQKTEDEVQLADATQLYADKEKELEAEIELFDATKTSCTEKTAAWSERSELRTKELEGIKKAIEILSSDEAKEIFNKKEPSFLQVASKPVASSGAKKAVKALQAHAKKSHSYRLAALAAQVRMQAVGHFDDVIRAIDKMLEQLKKEEQEDIKKVGECKEQYQDITLAKNDLEWKIEKNEAKIQKHEKAIEETTEAKEVTIESIEDAEKKLKQIEEDRKAENDAYLAGKADDEKAISLLEDAKAALKEYYGTNLLQTKRAEPDFRVSDKNNAKLQTDGVVALMDNIIATVQRELEEAKAAEEAAQLDYEKLKAAIEDQKAKLEETKINQETKIANEESSKTDEEDLKKTNDDSLETEKSEEAELKKSCDDAIKLQPTRAKKRATEVEGLTQAKEFLAGMEADAFVQAPKHSPADFPAFTTLSFLQRRFN